MPSQRRKFDRIRDLCVRGGAPFYFVTGGHSRSTRGLGNDVAEAAAVPAVPAV